MYLSGNFGELRNNHFHSGLDIKAQLGTPVYSVEEGFISRVSVSPYGYGLAVYIDHPKIGVTTVYGHLDCFASFLDKIVKKRQYEQEKFSVNLFFEEDEIKIEKGQIIAYSGNSGSSGGPHLHFEIRETKSEYLLDPISFFKSCLKDTRPPQIRSIAAYPVAGVINDGYVRKDFSVVRQNNGTMTLSTPLTAWGKIILGVKAYDYMNETTNIYGVYSIRLYVDEKLIYSSAIDRFSFDKSRMVNSFIDYEDWVRHKSFIMRSYVAPGNYLPVYGEVLDQGVITIDQERNYKVRYELRDRHGNLTTCMFPIKGVKRNILMDTRKNANLYNKDNYVTNNEISLFVPKGALYENVHLKCSRNSDNFYIVEPEYVPLHIYCNLKVKIPADTLENKKQYYLARITGKKEIPYTGEYKDGYLETRIREFGVFSVKCDLTGPVVTPISPAQWGRQGKIRVRICDKHVGIETFRGEIDGKFVLFEMDGKTSVLSFKLDPAYVVKNKKHRLKLVVTDRCGNQTVYKNSFYW
ncbi:M23 family metallopeptidase [Coprobacter sp.]